MNENRIKEYRIKKNLSMMQLSRITGISKRIYMSFRKWTKKKSVIRDYGKNI